MLCESEMERVSERGRGGGGGGGGRRRLLDAAADEMQQQQQLADGDAANLLGLYTVYHGE